MRQLDQQKLSVFATKDVALLITSICTPYTVLSAGFLVFVHWKVAVHRVHCTIDIHVLDFYFRSIAGHILYMYRIFFLPIHVLYFSSGHFCVPENSSVFAGIQMS